MTDQAVKNNEPPQGCSWRPHNDDAPIPCPRHHALMHCKAAAYDRMVRSPPVNVGREEAANWIVEKIIKDIIRPGWGPEERTCYELAGQLRAAIPGLSLPAIPSGGVLREALEKIAIQKTCDELAAEGDGLEEDADFVGAYDTLILIARTALAPALPVSGETTPANGMREALEQIKIVCLDNAATTVRHDLALEFVGGIAERALRSVPAEQCAEPVAWQKRPLFGDTRVWTSVARGDKDLHEFWLEQNYEIRPLYAVAAFSPPQRDESNG